jgi:hypothetical protein
VTVHLDSNGNSLITLFLRREEACEELSITFYFNELTGPCRRKSTIFKFSLEAVTKRALDYR